METFARRRYSRFVVAIDIVVVSYRSERTLRACVGPLAHVDGMHVFAVDNASGDGSLDSIADLPVTSIALDENRGFSHGNNVGIRAGDAPLVLFLNPDARIEPDALRRLARVLDDERVGAAAPKIVDDDGSLHFSQRRFPTLRATYARALFLHRLFPDVEELVRDPAAYEQPGSPDWVSGACVLVRRSLLERLGGWDESFFLYAEDIDLCRRIRDAGCDIRYEPAAVARHVGGVSAPRTGLLPVLTASRVRYARKHRGPLFTVLERAGLALGALTHLAAARGGIAARRGHARSLLRALGA